MARVPSSVTILGAGITSLSLAYRLTTLSPTTKVTIVEASDRVGGWMKTRTVRQEADDGLEVAIEEGPRSVRPKGGLGAARMLGLVSTIQLGVCDKVGGGIGRGPKEGSSSRPLVSELA